MGREKGERRKGGAKINGRERSDRGRGVIREGGRWRKKLIREEGIAIST
jgi:hypothetical protein